MSMVGVNQSLELHDKVEFHGIFGGIVAPIVSHLLKQLFFELLEFFIFHFALNQSTDIDVGHRVIAGALVFGYSVVELLNSVLSCSLMEKTDTHIVITEHFIVFILGTGACAVGEEILPTPKFDAYATRFVNVI